MEIDRPSRSDTKSRIGRLLRRYAPARSLRMARNRGPKAPLGTLGGRAAQVEVPQSGQIRRWSWYSSTTGQMGGTSATW